MKIELTYEEMQTKCLELDREVLRLRESEKSALRQNEYLTALRKRSGFCMDFAFYHA